MNQKQDLKQNSFTVKQQHAYNCLIAGKNVFLTGDAGTGKSYVIQKFIEYCYSKCKNIIITAPTGIAALNIDGVTLHRAFKAPIGPIVESAKTVSSLLKDADVVVIDEISMCRIDLFDFVITQIIYANIHRRKKGLADIQIVVVGDFFQLPPVLVKEEKQVLNKYYKTDIGYGFAFQSKYWEACNFISIILDEVVRQSDGLFIQSLNQARKGRLRSLQYFTENSCKQEIKEAILLCGTNKAVKEKNDTELAKIKSPSVEYEAIITGEVKESDKMTNDILTLKVGARVMTLVNDSEDRYCNGSFGSVIKLNKDTVVVQMDNGCKVEIGKYKWSIKGYELKTSDKDTEKKARLEAGEIGSFEQFPLKLAYAITIHKSQGQTYDAVNLNPYCWDCGQLYVALSRCKSVNKIYLTQPIKANFLKASKEVLNFYKSLA